MTPDMEEVGGTVLSPDAFRKVMKARRDELLQTRLVTEKALRRLDQEVDIYDTFESLMRELAEGPSVAAALAVAKFLTADDGAPAPVTKVSGELRLEDEDRFV